MFLRCSTDADIGVRACNGCHYQVASDRAQLVNFDMIEQRWPRPELIVAIGLQLVEGVGIEHAAGHGRVAGDRAHLVGFEMIERRRPALALAGVIGQQQARHSQCMMCSQQLLSQL